MVKGQGHASNILLLLFGILRIVDRKKFTSVKERIKNDSRLQLAMKAKEWSRLKVVFSLQSCFWIPVSSTPRRLPIGAIL